jgi:hypothetical protein
MLGWDRNPLRRRTDRVEAAMIAGPIAVFLISAPALTAAGHWIGAAGMQQQRAEAAWRPVPATVQGQIPSGPAAWMLARWTAPDGQPRSGWIPASLADAADRSAQVWVTRTGALTGPPVRHSQIQGRIAIADLVTVLGLGLILCLAGGTGRVLLTRRRLADWNRAWRVAEPRWTRHGQYHAARSRRPGRGPPRNLHVRSSPGVSQVIRCPERAQYHPWMSF